MKRSLTINIFGTLYPIDEDAFELLRKYQDTIRAHFSQLESGQEIADDLECRIAELLNQYLAQGINSITIDNVRQIISQIGEPTQFADPRDIDPQSEPTPFDGQSDPATPPPYAPPAPAGKKLFRDPDHKVIGGVLSGLANYWGINPLWLRLAAILLAWISMGFAIVVYLVAWVSIPLAVTPADRLQMMGEPVNWENLRDIILNDSKSLATPSSTTTGEIFSTILRIIIYIILGAILAFCGIALCSWLVFGVFSLLTPATLFPQHTHIYEIGSLLNNAIPKWVMATASISMISLIGLTIWLSICGIRRIAGKPSQIANTTLVAIAAAWVLSAIVLAGALTSIAIYVNTYRNQRIEARNAEQKHLIDQAQADYLQQNGWEITTDTGTGGQYTALGRHYSGNPDIRVLQVQGDQMQCQIQRVQKTAPGTYTLTAIARTDGTGSEIFATTATARYAAPIPVYGNRGGEIWTKTRAEKSTNDCDRTRRILKTHNGKGWGWSHVTIPDIIVGPDSIIIYGITNISPSQPWTGSWMAASDFVLKATATSK